MSRHTATLWSIAKSAATPAAAVARTKTAGADDRGLMSSQALAPVTTTLLEYALEYVLEYALEYTVYPVLFAIRKQRECHSQQFVN
jgi:hypothetical protein